MITSIRAKSGAICPENKYKKSIESGITYKQNHKTIALRKTWTTNEKDETSLTL